MITEKPCTKCGKIKPLEDFPRDPRMRLGRRSSCTTCMVRKTADWKRRNPDKVAAQVARRPKPNPEKRREIGNRYYQRHRDLAIDRQRRRQTGAPLGTYAKLLSEQQGRCAICGEEGALHLDHDHETRRIRGLLCKRCNMAIGLLRHSIDILAAAVRYLA